MEQYYHLPEYPAEQIATELDKRIVELLNKYNVVGSQHAVIKNGNLIFTKGYGYANLPTKKEMTPDIILRTASISKMFTGTAIMQLYEQEKIDLHTDISNYLGYKIRNPKYPDITLTVSDLLTHTSSIFDSGTYNTIIETKKFNEKNVNGFADIPLKEMLMQNGKFYSAANYSNYKPGTKFIYSNFGYGILGSIIEKITNERFPQYCLNHIFKPLDMNASFEPADINKYKNIGTLYKPVNNIKPFCFTPGQDNYINQKPAYIINNQSLGNALPYSPAGSVRTSINDLSHFMLMMMNGGIYMGNRILNSEIIDLMTASHWQGNERNEFFKSYGYSIHRTKGLVEGIEFCGHSANAYGLIGFSYLILKKKFAIMSLFTGGSYGKPLPFYSIENKIAELLFNKFNN